MDWMWVLVVTAVAAVGLLVWNPRKGGSGGEPAAGAGPTVIPDKAGGKPEN